MFQDLTFDDAKRFIDDLQKTSPEYLTTDTRERAQYNFDQQCTTSGKLFRKGDHWQGTKAWIGPRPETTAKKYNDVMLEIRRGLVSQNVIAEAVHRRNSAVIGREPDWGLTPKRPLKTDEKPNTQEQTEIDAAEATATEWWDAREALKVIQESADELSDGRGLLRLFVPSGLLTEVPLLQGEGVLEVPFEQAIDFIYLHAPDPNQATIIVDPSTQRKASLYFYEHTEGNYWDSNAEKYNRIEMSYVDGGMTVVKILTEDGDPLENDTMRLNLGGHLMMYEMKDEPLITEQVKQHQCLLNMARTMMGRNVVLGGFLERVFLNAQLPGQMQTIDGKETFVPNPLYVGAGTTNTLVGVKTTNADGSETVANPSVVYRDPVKVDTFEATASSAYKAILEETHQLHALISGDATASGESRKQAMDDFRKSLQPVKSQLDSMGRWLIETMLAMASQFSGAPGRFAEFRAVFDCQIDVGAVSADEKRVMQEEVKSKLRSRENYITSTDVSDDADAELAKIASEEEQLNPLQSVQIDRAKLGLQRDKQNADGGISSRLESAGQGSNLVQ